MCLSVHAGANDDDDDDDGVQVFRGNPTSADHFNELFVERSSLLLGARSAYEQFHVLPASEIQTSLSLFLATIF